MSHDFVKENKSQLYTNLLGIINARKIELPDNKRLISELIGLERRTGFAGQDRIDHAPGCHDDVANAVAGLAQIARDNGGFSLECYLRAYLPEGVFNRHADSREEAARRARGARSRTTRSLRSPTLGARTIQRRKPITRERLHSNHRKAILSIDNENQSLHRISTRTHRRHKAKGQIRIAEHAAAKEA